MIFGAVIGANNIAHAGGFLAGAVLGFVVPPRWLRRGVARGSDYVIGAVSVVVLVAALVLVLHPPASSDAWARAYADQIKAYRNAAAAAAARAPANER